MGAKACILLVRACMLLVKVYVLLVRVCILLVRAYTLLVKSMYPFGQSIHPFGQRLHTFSQGIQSLTKRLQAFGQCMGGQNHLHQWGEFGKYGTWALKHTAIGYDVFCLLTSIACGETQAILLACTRN